MILDPRAIALQGVGYAPMAVALQGYVEIELEDVAGVGQEAPRIEARAAQSVDFILQARAEDEILLAVITQAVTTGMLNQWRIH